MGKGSDGKGERWKGRGEEGERKEEGGREMKGFISCILLFEPEVAMPPNFGGGFSGIRLCPRFTIIPELCDLNLHSRPICVCCEV